MQPNGTMQLPQILQRHEVDLLNEWVSVQVRDNRRGMIKEAELREQCREFLRLLTSVLQQSGLSQFETAPWNELRSFLAEVSRKRGVQGFSPSETATFVFSFKRPVFALLRKEFAQDPEALWAETWAATELLDRLGLWTVEAYQTAREDVIARQQQDMLDLSTPVVKLWDGVLALPIIGTLDSARSQVAMEALLEKIVSTSSSIAIIDITGVPTVDTLTAQHLLKTVTAARLMGADCIISGIRPQIAQTLVHLGVELNEVLTKASLSDAFRLALERVQLRVVRVEKQKNA